MAQFTRREDAAAFEELVRRWDRRVLGFLAKASGDREAAKDMRQEVFLRVYRHGATYNPEFAFSTWLYRIAGNVLRTWQTRRGRLRAIEWPESPDTDMKDPSPGPMALAERSELRELMRAAARTLSLDDRELILLRLDAGMTYREIAAIQETPEPTVKSRFYAALARLRAALYEAVPIDGSLNS